MFACPLSARHEVQPAAWALVLAITTEIMVLAITTDAIVGRQDVAQPAQGGMDETPWPANQERAAGSGRQKVLRLEHLDVLVLDRLEGRLPLEQQHAHARTLSSSKQLRSDHHGVHLSRVSRVSLSSRGARHEMSSRHN